MNYLQKELYDLVKKDDSIFDFLQDSSLDGMWYWDLENFEEEWMNARFWEKSLDMIQQISRIKQWHGKT